MKYNLNSYFFPPIHKEGIRFIVACAIASVVLLFLNQKILSVFALAATFFCYFFFRDPNRVIPYNTNYIVSPADGIISFVGIANPPEELEMPDAEMTLVSIFMSPFHVHVNRSPIHGTISKIKYKAGKFFNASLNKASKENERNSLVIESENGVKIACVQIAGLIAKRIVCNVQESDKIQAGERYGIIRFGSRLDVYLPKDLNILVAVGQKSIAGESIIANLDNVEQRSFFSEHTHNVHVY